MEKEEIQKRFKYFIDIRCQKEGTINAMLQMKPIHFDMDNKTVMLSFPVHTWESNPHAHMHGGIICAILDVTMGCASYTFSQATFTPTIQMSVNFVKGIPEHEVLLVEGILDHVGTRMAQVRAIARLERTNEIVATANGSYAINTRK